MVGVHLVQLATHVALEPPGHDEQQESDPENLSHPPKVKGVGTDRPTEAGVARKACQGCRLNHVCSHKALTPAMAEVDHATGKTSYVQLAHARDFHYEQGFVLFRASKRGKHILQRWAQLHRSAFRTCAIPVLAVHAPYHA